MSAPEVRLGFLRDGVLLPWPAGVRPPCRLEVRTTPYEADLRDARGQGLVYNLEYYCLEALPHENPDTIHWEFSYWQWHYVYRQRTGSEETIVDEGDWRTSTLPNSNPYGIEGAAAAGRIPAGYLLGGYARNYRFTDPSLYTEDSFEVSNLWAVLAPWTRTPTGLFVRTGPRTNPGPSESLVFSDGALVQDL